MNKFLSLLIFNFTFFSVNLIYAKTLSSALEDEVQTQFGTRYSFKKILNMEKVGTEKENHYVVEIEISKQSALRIPAKLVKEDTNWKVKWLPKKSYVDALHNMLRSETLTEISSPSWFSVERLPTFPLIFTEARIFTPFGPLTKYEEGDKFHPLLIDAKRWIHEILMQDPAPASFEIIAPSSTSWKSIHTIMFQLAALSGLFEMHLVGISGKKAVSFPLLAAVASIKNAPKTIFTLGRIESREGLILNAKLKEGPPQYLMEGCPNKLPEGKYCAAEKDPVDVIGKLLLKEKIDPKTKLMFGFSPTIKVGEAMKILTRLAQKTKSSTRRFIVTMVVE